MRAFFFSLIVLMFLITLTGFFPLQSSFFFAGGSNGLMQLVSSNVWVGLLMIIFLCLLYWVGRFQHKFYFLMLPVLLLWVCSGRVVGLFPDGRISAGWFYVETSRIGICKSNDDCEKVFEKETIVEEISFWRIRIRNNKIDTVLFLGPLSWNRTITMLKKNFPSSSFPSQ